MNDLVSKWTDIFATRELTNDDIREFLGDCEKEGVPFIQLLGRIYYGLA